MGVKSAQGDPPIRAAEYLRMSTDRQIYSTANQAEKIAAYALLNGFEIVRSYIDGGRSGLHLKGRAALQQLLAEVVSGKADFEAILVYDVSRWGRFQDTDESAHYEFICRSAGVKVHYCAETFDNDGSLTAAILKNLKRVMAGEYSRELSAKIFHGQSRLAAMGYKVAGPAPYAMQRLLLSSDGTPKFVLKPGESKSLRTERIALIPGPADEVALVQRMFRLAAKADMTPDRIAALFNKRGLTTRSGLAWRASSVKRILSDEIYLGTIIYNKRSSKLKGPHVDNRPDQWIKKEGIFPPVVPRDLFMKVAGARQRKFRHTRDELLAALRALLEEKGFLSAGLINRSHMTRSVTSYKRAFGALSAAYERIGYSRYTTDYAFVPDRWRDRYLALIAQVGNALDQSERSIERGPGSSLLLIDGRVALLVQLVLPIRSRKAIAWKTKLCADSKADFMLAALKEVHGDEIVTYYLLPREAFPRSGFLQMGRHFALTYTDYRVDNLARLSESIDRLAQFDAEAWGQFAGEKSRDWLAKIREYAYVPGTLLNLQRQLVANAAKAIRASGGSLDHLSSGCALRVDHEINILPVAVSRVETSSGCYWKTKLNVTSGVDFVLLGLSDKTRVQIQTYYLIPPESLSRAGLIHIGNHFASMHKDYQITDLAMLHATTRRWADARAQARIEEDPSPHTICSDPNQGIQR